jgi:phosphoglycolate phosphatase-like HAD superfamily hydrolase
VETGKNAGTHSAMVMTGYGRAHSTQLESTPDVLADDLLAAVREVLR